MVHKNPRANQPDLNWNERISIFVLLFFEIDIMKTVFSMHFLECFIVNKEFEMLILEYMTNFFKYFTFFKFVF